MSTRTSLEDDVELIRNLPDNPGDVLQEAVLVAPMVR